MKKEVIGVKWYRILIMEKEKKMKFLKDVGNDGLLI